MHEDVLLILMQRTYLLAKARQGWIPTNTIRNLNTNTNTNVNQIQKGLLIIDRGHFWWSQVHPLDGLLIKESSSGSSLPRFWPINTNANTRTNTNKKREKILSLRFSPFINAMHGPINKIASKRHFPHGQNIRYDCLSCFVWIVSAFDEVFIDICTFG